MSGFAFLAIARADLAESRRHLLGGIASAGNGRLTAVARTPRSQLVRFTDPALAVADRAGLHVRDNARFGQVDPVTPEDLGLWMGVRSETDSTRSAPL